MKGTRQLPALGPRTRLDDASDAVAHVPETAQGVDTARGDGCVLAPGSLVPGTSYRIEARIGEGGMGTLFAATHLGIDRKVALKALHAELCLSARAVTTFRNEARASARIGAPNIVDIFDFVELEDGRQIIAMEYLEGTSLQATLHGPRPTIARLVDVARQMCRGLAAAHEAGIVHRDIKPDNVMLVRREGREDFVKLVDFGIAAFENEGDVGFAGTPHYMAPESIGREPIDGRVDQYALGCLLYEWAVGRPPFDGDTHKILRAHLEEAVVFPNDGPALPARLRAIIERCLAKHPADRFADMHAVEAALCELQDPPAARARVRGTQVAAGAVALALAALAGAQFGERDARPGASIEPTATTAGEAETPAVPAPLVCVSPAPEVGTPESASSAPELDAEPTPRPSRRSRAPTPPSVRVLEPESRAGVEVSPRAQRYLERAAQAERRGWARLATRLYARALVAGGGDLGTLEHITALLRRRVEQSRPRTGRGLVAGPPTR